MKFRINNASFPVLVILIMSTSLNLWGIGHDLPYCYEHDELNFVTTALSFGKGDLHPHNFIHGSFLYYLLFLEYFIFYFIKVLSGGLNSAADFVRYYINNPGIFILIGRATVVITAAASVFLAYKIGERLIGRFSGILSALFMSFSLLFVNLAHVVKEEIFYGFFLLLSFWYVIAAKSRRSFYLASFLIGLAAAAKYLSILGMIFVMIGFFMKGRLPIKKENIKTAVLMLIFAAAGFIIAQPFALIDMSGFIRQIFEMKAFFSSPVGDRTAPTIYLYFLYLKRSLGIWLFVIFLLSFMSIFNKRRKNENILLIPYIVVYFLFISRAGHAQPSYLMGVLPFACIFAAMFTSDMILMAGRRLANAFVYFAVGVLLAAPSLLDVLRYDYLLMKPDTRALAKMWVEKNIPENARILVEGAFPWEIVHNAPLTENAACLESELEAIRKSGGNGLLWNERIALLDNIKTPKYFVEKEQYFENDVLNRHNARYVIVSSFYDHGFWASQKNRQLFYDDLHKKYALLKEFKAEPYIVWFPSFNTLRENPENLGRVDLLRRNQELIAGPNLEIYKRK